MALKGLVPELYCKDFEVSLLFYTKQLGFRILYDRPEDKFAYLEREGSEIMIEQVTVGRKWVTGELAYPYGRGMSFQIAATNVKDLHSSLEKAGIGLFLPLEDKWYRKGEHFVGNRQFIVQDPDGFLLRFAQDLGQKTASKN